MRQKLPYNYSDLLFNYICEANWESSNHWEKLDNWHAPLRWIWKQWSSSSNFCIFHAVIDTVFYNPQTVAIDILNSGWSNNSTKEAVDFGPILANTSETVMLKNLYCNKYYKTATELLDAKKRSRYHKCYSRFEENYFDQLPVV